MVNSINIKNLNLEELVGVVNIYPWYGAARKELCARMAGTGMWSGPEYSEAALYIGSRRIIADLVSAGSGNDCSDKDLSELLRSFIEEAAGQVEEQVQPQEQPARQIVVIGGDYFSQNQYNQVRKPGDNIFSSFATKAREDGYSEDIHDVDPMEFCTETLAQIYLEQDYPEKAKEIYSKLILRYPEKSIYFASLIEKIDNQK